MTKNLCDLAQKIHNPIAQKTKQVTTEDIPVSIVQNDRPKTSKKSKSLKRFNQQDL